MRNSRTHRWRWVSGGGLCVLAGGWMVFAANAPVSVARAQQDTWTTDAARRQNIRILETRDASGPSAYPIEPGDLLFFTNVDSHGGSFVAYMKDPNGVVGETVSDQNGLHGSAREAARKRVPWRPTAAR
ncbi:MAG: hypothetical protein A3F70_08420 [Acidobacteria bacterium RIFCSPLOWO2_12_FULL_67_14]|nr:MAG: hypothetical protein A3H29_01585 [Acidobacteria bacterium RIFCSPLOWO2_02_FULL_67_21]OFW40746.1 MAG: hypothetical protein A3F70_08420 [Acidobacteria bacterium RIFCSPLOWO2_12_FULL_67_14]